MKKILVWGISVVAALALMISSSVFLTACKSKNTPKNDENPPVDTAMTLSEARDLANRVADDLNTLSGNNEGDMPEPASYSLGRAAFPINIWDGIEAKYTPNYNIDIEDLMTFYTMFNNLLNCTYIVTGQTYTAEQITDLDEYDQKIDFTFNFSSNKLTINMLLTTDFGEGYGIGYNQVLLTLTDKPVEGQEWGIDVSVIYCSDNCIDGYQTESLDYFGGTKIIDQSVGGLYGDATKDATFDMTPTEFYADYVDTINSSYINLFYGSKPNVELDQVKSIMATVIPNVNASMAEYKSFDEITDKQVLEAWPL